MFYICVICMVDATQDSLVTLTKERRRLWETIVTPLVNVVRLKSCILRICSDCNQLLISMVQFQNTMVNGARNMLRLQAQFKPAMIRRLKYENVLDTYSYVIMTPFPDLMVPVATEEVVCTTEETWHWDSIEQAELIPIKENSINLYCEEVESISSGVSKVEVATPLPEIAKEEVIKAATDISKSDEVGKTKLNRLLFDAIRVTLQSPTLKNEFETKYEPEPESKSDQKSKTESEQKSQTVQCGEQKSVEQSIQTGHDPGFKSGIESEFDSARVMHELEYASDTESVHSCGSGCESIADSESTLPCTSDYDDAEHYPNIIFARSFNEVSEDGQIHSHIVTNPPSEWPCNWERCILQDIYREDEVSETDKAENGHLDLEVESDSGLNGHMETVTKSDDVKKRRIKRYRRKGKPTRNRKCGICRKFYLIGARFWNHCDRHHSAELTEKCDVCRERFANETELQLHKIRHNKYKKSFKCPMCSATFKSTRSLRRHAAEHILSQAQDTQAQDTQTQDTQTQYTQTQNTSDTQTNRQTRKRWQNSDTAMHANGQKRKKQTEKITHDNVTYNGQEEKSQRKKRTHKNKELYIDGMTYEIETDIANGQTRINTHTNGYDVYARSDGHDYIHTLSYKRLRNGQNCRPKFIKRILHRSTNMVEASSVDTAENTYAKPRKAPHSNGQNTGRVRKRRKTRKRARIQAPILAEQEMCMPVITNVTSLCNTLFD